MDISSLNSLKVADLKQLLKTRGLSIVGNKSELIQRLESAMLNDPTNSGSVEKSAKLIEKEIDEDAILGEDDGSFSKPDESLIHNEELLLSEASIDTSNIISKDVSNQVQIKAMIASPIAKANNSNETVNSQSDNTTTKPVSSLKQLAGSKTILSLNERKQMRQLKFADPKVLNRAERFGESSLSPVAITENDKLKQRMQRFGEVVSKKAKTIDEKERVEKRKERFGAVGSVNNNNGYKHQSTPKLDENIQKRQDRFGLVENAGNKSPNKINSGFKRRRFAF